jgi:hypothetical protein
LSNPSHASSWDHRFLCMNRSTSAAPREATEVVAVWRLTTQI